jgi:hypothetical protein
VTPTASTKNVVLTGVVGAVAPVPPAPPAITAISASRPVFPNAAAKSAVQTAVGVRVACVGWEKPARAAPASPH